jgi:plastocyanin
VTRRLPLLLATASLALGAASCGGDDGGGGSATKLASGDTIGMKQLEFDPAHVEVAVGQTVTWENGESVPHDVVATDGADFKSDTFGKGGRFTWKADKAGTVKYECTLHPGMEGTLEVVGG